MTTRWQIVATVVFIVTLVLAMGGLRVAFGPDRDPTPPSAPSEAAVNGTAH
jgi:hypothetical protein